MNAKEFEKRSSAVSLSDMEIFIFPELMYSLLLANLMSPRIWRWRNDPWFKDLHRKKPAGRINRLKQYIMNNYSFNLDLDTWGLTTKEREMARFADFIDKDTLARSNALFGYEGDKYYFDIDIRSHFGLQQYDSNVIPYWKTETVEAMDAFVHKPGYNSGAGECVSLAALYATAVHLIAGIPLEDIYLMATPLHSQNYLDVDEGILTNNRRLVTKNMWFNGTALSAQARRALENEKVTIVSHLSGYIHTIYDEATIDPAVYRTFDSRLKNYLHRSLSVELLGDFLRHARELQCCFQLRHQMHGRDYYVGLDTVFQYEHGTPYRMNDNTRDRLLGEIEMSEFKPCAFPGKMVLNDLEEFVRNNDIDLNDPADTRRFQSIFASDCKNTSSIVDAIIRFSSTEPQLPDPATVRFQEAAAPLAITADMDREAVIEHLEGLRAHNETADLAFYAYRDLSRTEAEPFIAAAVERNPVCIEALEGVPFGEIAGRLEHLSSTSIYDEGGRLAQPDEVWNFQRGDGVEKALLLAAVMRRRHPEAEMEIVIDQKEALFSGNGHTFRFTTAKSLAPCRWPIPVR